MDSRRNAIGFENKNNLDDDQNSAINNLVINTTLYKLENNVNDMNLIKALSAMPTRFKEAFESILKVLNYDKKFLIFKYFIWFEKTNRVEDFDESQNFRKIQDKHSISNPFVDNKFRPCDQSIYYTQNFKNWLHSLGKTHNRGEFVWKRAKDLYSNAQFAVDDREENFLSVYNKINENNYKTFFRTTDLDQGSLGTFSF